MLMTWLFAFVQKTFRSGNDLRWRTLHVCAEARDTSRTDVLTHSIHLLRAYESEQLEAQLTNQGSVFGAISLLDFHMSELP